jgi:DNA-binding NtrC family response regulator
MKWKIAVVDDEKLIRWSLEQYLRKEGYEISSVEDGESILSLLNEEMFDLILLDIKLPGIDGIEVLENIRNKYEDLIVIIMTAHGDVETAVKAMKLGAYDYINKPFNLEEIVLVVNRALENIRLRKEVNKLRRIHQEAYGINDIIGESEPMKRVFEIANKIAKSDTTTVLLTGESGTGKNLFAKFLHYNSSRANSPFVQVDCTSLPETLIESELFGHEKWAFTDAKTQKKGLFETADGGTIFLDEIGDMPISLQAKMLRVIENKSFRKLGGTKDIYVNVRVIASTNKDIEKYVKEGKFREDLYYRLNVFPINLPPLRDRKDDIIILSKYFIDMFNKEFKKNVKGLSSIAEEILLRYDWPGNVRELRNVIERAIILGGTDYILAEHLPLDIMAIGSKRGSNLKMDVTNIRIPKEGISLEKLEMELVRQAMEITKGNQTRAAKLLGITRDSLRYRLQKIHNK